MPISNTSSDVQLWVAGSGGGNELVSADGDAGTASGGTAFNLAHYYQSASDNPATTTIAEGFFRPTDIVFDTVHGKFFISDSDLAGHNRILQGNIADLTSGAPPALTILYSDPASGTASRIDNLDIDPNSGIVYFTHGQRFEKVGYDTAGQTPTILMNFGAGSGNPVGTSNNFFTDMVVDFTTGDVYLSSTRVLAAAEGDTVTKNYIYHLSGLTAASGAGAFSFSGGTASLLPFSPQDDEVGTVSPLSGEAFPMEEGSLAGLALDPVTHTLYFSTGALSLDTDEDPDTDPDHVPGAIFSYALTGNPTGTYTQIFEQNGANGPQGLMDDIEIDPTTGRWYVNDTTGGTPSPGDEAVWTGNLDGTGTPSQFALINNPSGEVPSGFTLDIAPDLTGISTSATATETAGPGSGFSAAVQPLAAIQATDFDTGDQTDQLAGARVRISAGFGSAPGSSEQLTINGTTSGTLDFGSQDIAYSYNSLTGVMTLTGASTLDNYEAALALVSYSISGDNPDANGTAPSRTIAYSVTDGLLYSDEEAVTLAIAGTNDGPANTTGGAVAASEDASSVAISGLSVSDPDSSALTVTLAVGRGTLAVDTGVSGGVGAGQVSGNGSGSVTITGTAAAINATLAAATGLAYTPTPNVNGADTLTMTTSDGSAQDVDLVAINVAAVNDAPVVAGDGTESAAPIVQDTPSPTGQTVAALFGGQYSDATDQVAGGSSADAFAGVAVTANGSSGATGQWQYFNGSSWVNIGAASTGSAVLLSAGTSVRFNPAAGFSGAAPTLSVHLVDGSGGGLTSGANADVSVSGGTTRYSSGTVLLDETVIPGNTPPTGVTGSLHVHEDANNGTVVGTVVATDPDSSTFTYTLVNDAGGRFDISTSGVVTVQNGLLLDYEQSHNHTIRVQVDDHEGGVSQFDMSVGIDDVHGEFVNGDGANNVFYGGAEIDLLFGGLGSDTIHGGGNSDVINGGSGLLDPTDGNDFLFGDGGSDLIYGNCGNDTIAGGADSDVIFGGYGNDTIYGGDSASDTTETGNDVISGDAGNDVIYGNGGNDFLYGGDDNDQLFGGAGADTLSGDDGIDTLSGGTGADTLTGGAGNDVFVFRKGEANGDIITDFKGNGNAAGDSIRLEGYAAGTTFTQVGHSDTWKINDHGTIELVTIHATGTVHSSDYHFF